ncbi:TPA: hypothetical protein SL686_006820 [Pseudomonas aeruginosa]|uniref:DUF6670 family protein n=1 Tax=Pseudomonas aeruginosa TaxID=287 RepID=UPI0003B9BE83|nr:DUF6670 family protein [Pseudomonas aeruginosa]ERV77375.1 hypothetical protein Q058_03260 [Pseudomonas aeruginosa BL04]KSD44301.1 hypothetical protein AO901_11560 [Pseudomonas aeruginosa]KSE16276.1 hypothetical protein AO922_18145 [Pseudomonas aeruginosa]KSE86034.1 hypothetical protein AO924_04765 [Pseudomonas aeruginosa]MBG5151491.1 hypothetical protein [Pseudomonas aeruginosa]
MRLPKPLLDFIDHSLALSGRPFEPDTSLAPPHGRYATVHYGIMLPGLPAPHHFLNLVAVIGQPKTRLFANPHLIRTTARDTANLLVGTATGTPEHFRGYSIGQDCTFAADGSSLRFADDLVLEGRYPDFSARREGHAFNLQLTLKATDKVANFASLIGGLYDHWSVLCQYRGHLERNGERSEIAGLCTFEYARAVNVNLPFRFFTYQILNLDARTQVLLVEVLGPLGLEAQRRVYLRSLDDHGGVYLRGFDFSVQRFAPTPVTTPNGTRMRLPQEFTWRVEDDDGNELITIRGDANGDFQYGLAAGYVGSYRYEGRFRGRPVSGTGYIEYIDLR